MPSITGVRPGDRIVGMMVRRWSLVPPLPGRRFFVEYARGARLEVVLADGSRRTVRVPDVELRIRLAILAGALIMAVMRRRRR